MPEADYAGPSDYWYSGVNFKMSTWAEVQGDFTMTLKNYERMHLFAIEAEAMPPDCYCNPLSDADFDELKAWLEADAPDALNWP